ncbi:suppressor of tumorigenicity 14 protein [Biomphalaria glabrata]|nr:suppressor of tumorigenicity 14 protein [Biomphalaria glabrata]
MNQRIPAVEERIINSDVRSDANTRERSLGGDHEDPLKPDEAVERHMQVERYQQGPNLTDVGPVAKTGEESPDGGKENPRQSDVDIDGHLKDESHRQGLKPTSDWADTETREKGPDGGEESRMEPEAEDEGPLHLECCQPAPRACTPDKAEDDDLFHNSLSCGFESHPSPSSQSPMKPPLLPTILVIPALTSYTSPCVNWLPSVPNDKRAMQLQRHCNKKTINWRKRRRRRLLSTTCMVRLPRNNCSHMKTNWRRRRRRLLLLNARWMTMQPRYHCNHMKTNWRRRRRRLLLSAIWMTMRSRGRYNQMKANWRRRKRFLNSTWMAMKARRPCNQVKTNWRRRRKRPLLTATWMAPSSSRGKPTATDRPPPAAMKLLQPMS